MSQPCARCGGRTTYIGISGGAELACVQDCAGKCPACLSEDVEDFRVPRYWSLYGPQQEEPDRQRCVPCGKVFDKEQTPVRRRS